VNKSLERAQAGRRSHFDIRKQLLKFDDVMNDQRKVIFVQRRDIMESRGTCKRLRRDMRRNRWIDDLIDQFIASENLADQWDTQGFPSGCCSSS